MPSTQSSVADRHASIPPSESAGWRWAPAWVLTYVALWPAPGYAEAVLVLGALVAIFKLVTSRFSGGAQLLSNHAWALTSVLFCAYWVPEVVSAVDSIDHVRALKEAAVDLRYLPFLWLAASAVANERGRRITFVGLAIILGVWTLDALVQAGTGTSLLFSGMDAAKLVLSHKHMCTPEDMECANRLTGVFGPCNCKLGQVAASLSPFALYAAAKRFGRVGWLVAAALIGVAIVLIGSRGSWVTYAVVLALSGWSLLGWKRLAAVFAFGGAALLVLTLASPQVRERVERTTMVLTGEQGDVDAALSGRSRIWGAALCMVREHPVNGVGAQAFDKAFSACDPGRGHVAAWGNEPAHHAHQIVLEILSETGGFGLLLWLAGVALAWRAWRFADETAREDARPAMLALAATVFPFNTHLAFYSTFWGGITLLLAALYAGSLLSRDARG